MHFEINLLGVINYQEMYLQLRGLCPNSYIDRFYVPRYVCKSIRHKIKNVACPKE